MRMAILQEIDSKNFVILGGSDWGTEFGLYSFLERFAGVRWLIPSDIGIDIPKQASLMVSYDAKILTLGRNASDRLLLCRVIP